MITMDMAQVAKKLKVTTVQARMMVKQGIIPGKNIDGYWYADAAKWQPFEENWRASVDAKQAAKMLGMSKPNFLNGIRLGRIVIKSFPICRKYKRYMLEDVKRLVNEPNQLMMDFFERARGPSIPALDQFPTAHLSATEIAQKLNEPLTNVRYMLSNGYVPTDPKEFDKFAEMWEQTVPADVAAFILGVNTADVYEEAKKQGVKTMKVGRKVRYWKSDLIKVMPLMGCMKVVVPMPEEGQWHKMEGASIRVELEGLVKQDITGVKIYKEGDEVVVEVEYRGKDGTYTLIRHGGSIKVTAE